MKRVPLKTGNISLGATQFRINGVYGEGGSCIVYNGSYMDSLGAIHNVSIKELYPYSGLCKRGADNCITGISSKAKQRFLAASSMQSKLQSMTGLVNNTAAIFDVIEANGTLYNVLDHYNGLPLDAAVFNSLHDYISIITQVAGIIKTYHENGYLHLDIKPENIFLIPPLYDSYDSTGKAMILDFDSIIAIDDLKRDDIILSYSDGYAAPELKYNFNNMDISEKTDTYSIGAVLFKYIMKRPPGPVDGDIFKEWDIDRKSPLLAELPEVFFDELLNFFHRTLSTFQVERYQNDTELISALEKLSELSAVSKPYLESNINPYLPKYFTGRNAELQELHEKISESKHIFICGVGGVGKTSLALKYAEMNNTVYESILFVEYQNDINKLFTYSISELIVNLPLDAGSEDKKKVFSDICRNSRVLLIIDNFSGSNDEPDDYWKELECDMIITTRNRCDSNFLELNGLQEAKELFYHFCSKKYNCEEEKLLDDILNHVANHTLTVELLAKLLRDSDVSLETILERFKNYETSDLPDDEIRNSKDFRFNSLSVNAHIDLLFDLTRFSDEEKLVIQALILLYDGPVYRPRLMKICSICSEAALNSLVYKGWIAENPYFSLLSFHPIIFDRCMLHLPPSVPELDSLIETMMNNGASLKLIDNRLSGESKKRLDLWFVLLKEHYDTIDDSMPYYQKIMAYYKKEGNDNLTIIVNAYHSYAEWRGSFLFTFEETTKQKYKKMVRLFRALSKNPIHSDFDSYIFLGDVCNTNFAFIFGSNNEKCNEIYKCAEKFYLAAFKVAVTEKETETCAEKLHEFYEPMWLKLSSYADNPYKSRIKSEKYYKYTVDYKRPNRMISSMAGKPIETSKAEKELNLLGDYMEDGRIIKSIRYAKKLAKRYLKTGYPDFNSFIDLGYLEEALETPFTLKLLTKVMLKKGKHGVDLARIYIKRHKHKNALSELKYERKQMHAEAKDEYKTVLIDIMTLKCCKEGEYLSKIEEELIDSCLNIAKKHKRQENWWLAELLIKQVQKYIRVAAYEKASALMCAFASVYDTSSGLYYDYEYRFLPAYDMITERSDLLLWSYYRLAAIIAGAENKPKSLQFPPLKDLYLYAAQYAEKLYGIDDIRTAKMYNEALRSCDYNDPTINEIKRSINYEVLTEYEIKHQFRHIEGMAENCSSWLMCISQYEEINNTEKASEIMRRLMKEVKAAQNDDIILFHNCLECLSNHYFSKGDHNNVEKALFFDIEQMSTFNNSDKDNYELSRTLLRISNRYIKLNELSGDANYISQAVESLKKILEVYDKAHDSINFATEACMLLKDLDSENEEYYSNKLIQIKQM